MDLSIATSDPLSTLLDVLIVPLYLTADDLPEGTKAIDSELDGAIHRRIVEGDFSGKAGDAVMIFPDRKEAGGPERLLLLGLGKPEEATLEGFRRAIGKGIDRIRKGWAIRIGLLPPEEGPVLSRPEAIRALAEGALFANYRFLEHKTGEAREEEGWEPESLEVFYSGDDADDLRDRLRNSSGVAKGLATARDAANQPGNHCTPTELAEMARETAVASGLAIEVLGPEEMAELGMGAFLSVARGSEEPPRLVVLTHDPGGKVPCVVVVGKGVTFDSGGISIKPAAGMEEMKYDKSGAAATLGIMQAVAELGPPVKVVGIIGATENLLSGKATKPGDIVQAMNGTTIEVINTDAEGRLVLADCLAYAARFEPALVIDLATLTGACVVALGQWRAGLFTNADWLPAQMEKAAGASGERVWPMPLDEDYATQLESTHADVKNVGGKEGGAVTAAKFLEKFTSYPWAHLDIAGVAWDAKNKDYIGKGATGFGVRLVTELLCNLEIPG